MKIREAIESIARCATPIYGEHEAKQIGRIMVMELGHYTPTQIVLDRESECTIESLEEVMNQIAEGRPIQYIIGETEFCNLTFRVAEGVLIPRPETEELVRWIVNNSYNKKPRIVDVGTGSGAIAVSLANLIPEAEVYGVDISQDALLQARANAEANSTNVRFIEGDALAGIERSLPEGVKFDIVVSNPPYIPRSEAKDMRCNVVDYEPHIALFVDNSDPLIFYRRIAESALKILTQGGCLYYEIHESFAREMVEMLSQMGYEPVELREDINQKPRMICATKR